MAKPFGNGNNDNSNSYNVKTFNVTGYYVPAVLDEFENITTPAYNYWSQASWVGTQGNDFFYINQISGPEIDYSLVGPTIDGKKGADQVILTQDDVNVSDDFFTNMTSIEVFKLANGDGSSAMLGSEALEAGIKEVTGGSGNDTISFSSAYDSTGVKVNGAEGDDVISGAAGNDVLTGGTGADVLTGGGGADVFVFTSGSGNTDTVIDEIADLGVSSDTIRTGVAGLDGTNYVELAGSDFGAGVASLSEIVSAANTAFATLSAGATQYAVVENGSSDAANLGVGAASSTASYLVIDWNGDNTADQAILLTGVTDISTQISAATIVA